MIILNMITINHNVSSGMFISSQLPMNPPPKKIDNDDIIFYFFIFYQDSLLSKFFNEQS